MTSRSVFALQALALLLTSARMSPAATCSVSTGGAAFGASTAFTVQQADVVFSVTVSCSGAASEHVPITIAAAQGNGTYANRQMKTANWTVSYNLFVDSGRTQVWGDGTGITQSVSDTIVLVTGAQEDHGYTLYGRIPVQGNQSVGAATDSVTVTLTYQSSTASTSLLASYTVNPSCTVSAAALSFGDYDPVGAQRTSPLTAAAAVGYRCIQDPSVTPTFTLDQGQNPAGGSSDNAPLRRMTDGTHFLSYNLYGSTGCVDLWNNTTGFTSPGTGDPATLTVYGCIPAGQTSVPPGSYSDTVVITVTF